MQIPDHISASYIKNCYKNTSLSKSKSSKKLASGYRINTAADDAAKLSISEKMRAQIRGLDQASNNIQDSISFLQTADGVLESVSSIMQRIRELSVQAANDTYTDQDRAQIQQECDQLQEEMCAVFEQTAFHSIPIFSEIIPPDSIISDGEISNDLLQKGLPLFDSDQIIDGKTVPVEILNMVSRSLRMMAICKNLKKKLEDGKLEMNPDRTELYSEGKALIATYILEFLPYAKELKDYTKLSLNPITEAVNLVNKALQEYQEGKNGDTSLWSAWGKLQGYYYERDEKNQTMLMRTYIESIFNLIYINYNLWGHTPEHMVHNLIGSAIPAIYAHLEKTEEANLNGSSLLKLLQGNEYDDAFKMLCWLSGKRKMELTIQSGSNAYQGLQLQVIIPSVPITPFALSSHAAASASIQRIDKFFTRLSHARAEIGAYQNRLESVLSYTAQGAEALQDTESRMRDENMAKEVAGYLKAKLQNEFQQSFLAQKNASAKDLSVLSFTREMR